LKPKKKEKLNQSDGGQRIRAWLLGGLAAITVASVLLPADSLKAQQGAGLPLAVLTLLLGVAFCGLVLAGRIEVVRFGVVEWSIVLLVTVTGISAVATLKTGARPALNMAWQWIGMGMAFLLARQFVRTAAECRALVAIMLALAAFQSVYAGWQLKVERPQDRAEYERAKTADPNAPLPGIGYASATMREDFEARLNSNEPQGSFVLTNSLAGILATWIVVGVGTFVSAMQLRLSPPRVLVPLAIGLLAMLACLYQTHSRTAQLALAVGGVLLLATGGGNRLRRNGAWLIAATVVLLAAGLTLLLVTNWRPLAGPRLSVVYRLQYWNATWKMVRDHWLLGAGPGHFQDVYTRYMLPHYRESIADPHNFLLEVLATAGIPAALALVAGLVAFFAKMTLPGSPLPAAGRGAGGEGLRAAVAESPANKNAQSARQQEKRPEPHLELRGITLGATAGVLLAYLLGRYFSPVVQTDYRYEVVIIGLLAGAFFVWCLWPWVKRGTLPTGPLTIAVAVLLLNLLGAGGIAYPGVAVSLWLLMALGLALVEPGNSVVKPSRGVAAVAFLAMLLLAAACQWTAVTPVVRSRMYLDLAREAFERARDKGNTRAQAVQDFAAGRTWLIDAAQSDPWDADVYREMARHNLLAWLESRSEDRWDAFESAYEKWIELAHASAGAHKSGGDWFLQVYRATEAPELAQRAADAYRQAIVRYPANSLFHAQQAWAEHLAGNEQEAADAAAEALRLDQLNSHQDRNLGYEKVRLGGDPKVKDKSPEELMQSLIRGNVK